MQTRKLNLKTVFAKTALYRFIVIFIQALFTFMYVRDISKCLEISIIWNVVNMGLYFVYECAFSKKYSVAVQTKGQVIWFTGKPCSGKTTLAVNVIPELEKLGYNVHRLDGDVVRQSLCKDLGFSLEDRKRNLERVAYVAKTLADFNTIVLCSFVSPNAQVRDELKVYIGENKFKEIHVKCSSSRCAERDVKGMWAKAKRKEIIGFTGFDAPYEEPVSPDLTIDTENETLKESVGKVLNFLKITQ